MPSEQPNNPLHGIKLEQMLTQLLEHHGWNGLAAHIPINCFKQDPSIKSSLKFLRRTPWAREKVESLYLATFLADTPRPKRAKPPRAKTGSARPSGNTETGRADPWKKHRR